jgi:predicted ATP-grasp superfamily ATP-dependent carboligase
MHIFLYEWITGGGLIEESGRLPASLLEEGAAMLTALGADLLALEGAPRVTVLRDLRLDYLPLAEYDVREIHSRPEHDEIFAGLCAEADLSLVIAPEFDNILCDALARGRAAGGHLVAASTEFVRITSDKHLTALRLAEHHVPTPFARLLEPEVAELPHDFPYPAVLKPVCGAGSQHTLLVGGPLDEPPPYPWPQRLERYCEGTAASVAFLCGPEHRVALQPCSQHLAAGGRFIYLGGSLLLDEALSARATHLAGRALDALPPATGYVGVDLVLGKAGDGGDDVVIEVNPRLTTSYVGLRAASRHNLAHALLENAAGRPFQPEFRREPLEFHADGSIRT